MGTITRLREIAHRVGVQSIEQLRRFRMPGDKGKHIKFNGHNFYIPENQIMRELMFEDGNVINILHRHTLKEMIEAKVPLEKLAQIPGITGMEFKNAGVSAYDMMRIGWSERALRTMRYSEEEIQKALRTMQKLNNAPPKK